MGAGNGGVAFAFANDANARVYAMDRVPNAQAVECRRLLASDATFVTGDGAALPFRSDAIDLVLLLEVLEHLSHPAEVAAEIMRVLRAGGLCVVVTPARFAYEHGLAGYDQTG